MSIYDVRHQSGLPAQEQQGMQIISSGSTYRESLFAMAWYQWLYGWSTFHLSLIYHWLLSPCIIIRFNTGSRLHPSVTLIWQQVVLILLSTCEKIGYQVKNWSALPIWRTFLIKLDFSGIVNTNFLWVYVFSDAAYQMSEHTLVVHSNSVKCCEHADHNNLHWVSGKVMSTHFNLKHNSKRDTEMMSGEHLHRSLLGQTAWAVGLVQYKRGLNMMPLPYGNSFLFLLLRLKHGYNFHDIKLLCSFPSFATTRNNTRKIDVVIP